MHHTKEGVVAEVVVRPDTYATILVHAEPEQASSHRVEAAARLARDLGARLIGLGAETFDPSLFSGPFTGYAAGEWVVLVQAEIKKNLAAAEAAFHRDSAGADVEWRSVQDYPHRALVQASYAADLIVVTPRSQRSAMQSADPADVVMSAGRPVLIVPDGVHHLHGMSVVVAWKNTRECRRAVDDAMPFLQRAEDVIVHAVGEADAADVATIETADVVANLRRHGVEARALVTAITDHDITAEVERVAQLNGADLIVCGAYGHSRLREWAFGGVTADLLHRPKCFVLMSH